MSCLDTAVVLDSIAMAYSLQHLPADVLLHVFRYLPAADKFSVRACCRYFNHLVSHHTLWKGHTQWFNFKRGRYNPQFWTGLSCRRIQRAVVQGGATEKQWRQLSLSLPSLSTLVVDKEVRECIPHLIKFPKLRRLALRGHAKPQTSDLIGGLTVVDPTLMTRISLCGVDFCSNAHFLAFLSQFTNLTSLEYHSAGDKRSQVQMFHSIVAALAKLKHLSWAMNPYLKCLSVPDECLGDTADCRTHQTLSSLELVVHDDYCLSNHTTRLLAGLRSLTVVYVNSHEGLLLKTCLSHVHHLSTLIIHGGPPPRGYVRLIPATVTSLTLCVDQLTTADLVSIASQVTGLQHLQLDPWPSDCQGGLTVKLFPMLQSIKLRIGQIGERNFLDFRHGLSLQRVEVMDAADSPRFSELSRQLQTLSNEKIRVLALSRPRDHWACHHQVH